MKKNLLIIFTAIAIVLALVSSLLCFVSNARLTSMGLRIDEKLAALDYGEKLLRNPNALSYVNIFFDDVKLADYSKNFDTTESFSFPMRAGLIIFLSLASILHAVLVPVASILLLVLYFKKKSVFTLKLAHICACVGSILTLLPFTLSLLVQQNIYETASFEFSLINPYIIIAAEALYFIITAIIVNRMKISDEYSPVIVYSQAAYEEGGVLFGKNEPSSKKSKASKKSKKPDSAEA